MGGSDRQQLGTSAASIGRTWCRADSRWVLCVHDRPDTARSHPNAGWLDGSDDGCADDTGDREPHQRNRTFQFVAGSGRNSFRRWGFPEHLSIGLSCRAVRAGDRMPERDHNGADGGCNPLGVHAGDEGCGATRVGSRTQPICLINFPTHQLRDASARHARLDRLGIGASKRSSTLGHLIPTSDTASKKGS
jgi:hypothetical protein